MPSAPKASVPTGNLPVGEILFNSITRSDSSRKTEKTRDIFPMAKILFLIICLLSAASSGVTGTFGAAAAMALVSSSASSSLLQILRIARSMSVTRGLRRRLVRVWRTTIGHKQDSYFFHQRRVNSTRTRPWSLAASMGEACSWIGECSWHYFHISVRRPCYCIHPDNWGQRI